MGCDIHAMWERSFSWESGENFEHRYWKNAGDSDLNRHYEIFAVLGNVRNYADCPYISDNRINPYTMDTDMDWRDQPCDAMRLMMRDWGVDGHSHSMVTLKEMLDYDDTQTVYSNRLVMSRDEAGNITSTCGSTNAPGPHEVVGNTSVFGDFPNSVREWHELIDEGKAIMERYDLQPDQVRLVFFFDN